MDVAQERPGSWSPHIILFSIVLHVVVIYYIASAFNIVPPIIPTDEPRTIPTIRLTPQPPVLNIDEPEPIKRKPLFNQRQPDVPPITTNVPPSPLPATVATQATGPATISVGQPVPEEPVARSLPPYPVAALRDEKEGRVILSITIMPDGGVRDVQVVNAQPRGYFENAAIKSVKTWRYAPSNVIRTNVIVHMDFVLRG